MECCFIAVFQNALDLTAPASDALLKNRKNAWVQLAGHPGTWRHHINWFRHARCYVTWRYAVLVTTLNNYEEIFYLNIR